MSKILIVEDVKPMATLFAGYLKDEPYDVIIAETGARARQEIEFDKPTAILLDLKLTDENGLQILEWLKANNSQATVIVMTSESSLDTAVSAMKAGAADFLAKPFTADRLIYTLRNCMERVRLEAQVRVIKQDLNRNSYCGFLGSSLPMQALYRIIDNVARSTACVFITGESGTGKEVCAAAIHEKSDRAGAPFIALNCAAIPRELVESEIFGHTRGAFTGADDDRDGAALKANGGTLFLDEICEMDLSLQAKLLRFVQTQSFQKVGSDRLEKVDVRIICATNKDPLQCLAPKFSAVC